MTNIKKKIEKMVHIHANLPASIMFKIDVDTAPFTVHMGVNIIPREVFEKLMKHVSFSKLFRTGHITKKEV